MGIPVFRVPRERRVKLVQTVPMVFQVPLVPPDSLRCQPTRPTSATTLSDSPTRPGVVLLMVPSICRLKSAQLDHVV